MSVCLLYRRILLTDMVLNYSKGTGKAFKYFSGGCFQTHKKIPRTKKEPSPKKVIFIVDLNAMGYI